ncbi:hypothetical protein SEA_JACKO_109 [Microbacterium phage Jacko]|nr:hypothetical protein SEA_JACKO_109 [Microbacterium phage Jacko]
MANLGLRSVRYYYPPEAFGEDDVIPSQMDWGAFRKRLEDTRKTGAWNWALLTHKWPERIRPAFIRKSLGMTAAEVQVWQVPSDPDRGITVPVEILANEIPVKPNLLKIERQKNAPLGWDTYVRLTPGNLSLREISDANSAVKERWDSERKRLKALEEAELPPEELAAKRELEEVMWERSFLPRSKQKLVDEKLAREAKVPLIEQRRAERRAALEREEALRVEREALRKDDEAREAAKALHRERTEKNRAIVPKKGES